MEQKRHDRGPNWRDLVVNGRDWEGKKGYTRDVSEILGYLLWPEWIESKQKSRRIYSNKRIGKTKWLKEWGLSQLVIKASCGKRESIKSVTVWNG